MRSAIVYLGLLALIVGATAAAGETATGMVVSNREAGALEVGYLPADRAEPAANPPAMAWLPEPGAAAYFVELSQDRRFPPNATVRVERAPYCLYTHTEPLAPGRWYWRYGFYDAEGRRSDWSEVRSFAVTPQAVHFPRPTMEFVRANLPRAHPRLFVRPEQVAQLRPMAQGELRDRYLALRRRADAHLAEPLIPEPPPWTDGQWNAVEWRRNYGAVVRACNMIETMAFAYLLSGEEQYARRVREWLLHIAGWDPAGSTSIRVNDEAGMPILHLTSRAYDWVYDALSEDDRRIMREMIRARGEEAYRRLHGRPYEQRAYDSHGGRMWHFLGEAAIAYHGEVEEADRWLEYALTIFWGWYPIWSDSDGGWAEGVAYWSSYINRVTWWLDALRAATGVDGTRKPFFSRVGDFALYCAAPHSPLSGFGDSAERAASASAGRVANYFADAVGNPHWKWYAQAWGVERHEDSPLGFLRAAAPAVEPKPPDDLPLARLFRGTGWVAMHTDLSDAVNNLQLMFRSSPMGNISHAHADQNAIVLAAFGEPLLVNTGLRPWYGSEFCKQYYWATLSHNCLLVNGQGQERSPDARGEITAFQHHEHFTYVAGEAGPAYANAHQVTRRILFVRPDVLVIHDRVVAHQPGKVQWLMHGRSPFVLLSGHNSLLLRHGQAQARIVFAAPADLRFSQTDRYPLEPEMGTPVPEWHVTVETTRDEAAVDFVTVIGISRRGEPAPAQAVQGLAARSLRNRRGGLEGLATQGPGARFRRGDEVVTVAFADPSGIVRVEGDEFRGEAGFAVRGADGTVVHTRIPGGVKASPE